MANSERLAAEILTKTGLNGHWKEPSGVVLGKHRLFAGGSRNLPIISYAATEKPRPRMAAPIGEASCH